jgi:hypothetical protein
VGPVPGARHILDALSAVIESGVYSVELSSWLNAELIAEMVWEPGWRVAATPCSMAGAWKACPTAWPTVSMCFWRAAEASQAMARLRL